MVSGPYTSGASSPDGRAANLRTINQVAAEILALGLVPVIGVNMALPLIEAMGPETFDTVMMPLSLALAERCDACLRIGGPSRGADDEAEVFRRQGKPVFSSIAEVRDWCAR